MAEFTVTEVIDGDTFRVKPPWEWKNKTGDIVRPTGYNTPEEGEPGYEEAKRRLIDLILNKKVEVTNPKAIDKYGRLVADVYYNGKKSCRLFSRIQNLKGIIENKEGGCEIEIYWYGIKEKKTRRSSSVGKIQR